MTNNKLSVLISIYKNEISERFETAMQSIWDDQTLKPDEIVLVKDGGLGEKLNKVIEIWQSKLGSVLVVVPLSQNVGLGAALNEGLKYCSHELVARMDTDDFSMSHRFEKQVNFMTNHPDVAVSSGFIKEVDESGKTVSVRKIPLDHDELSKFGKTRSPISHATAIFRKSAVLAVGGYPPFKKGQDFALWSLMLKKGYKLANLPEILYAVPVSEDFFVRRGIAHLRHEFTILKYQKNIGFISWPEFIKNATIRSVARLSPNFLKKLLYKYGRESLSTK